MSDNVGNCLLADYSEILELLLQAKTIAYQVGCRSYWARHILCLLTVLAQLFWPYSNVFALDRLPESSLANDDFRQQYTTLTKLIMLKGVELERFSLHYRLEDLKQPKFRQWRYFLSQEAGVSCILAFE